MAPDPEGGASIARNTALAFAVQVATASFTAGLTLFLVRALSPDRYGLFALALSVGGLLLIPSDFGISQSAARFIAERRGGRAEVAGILADALKLKLLASGITCAALFAVAGPIAEVYGKPGLAWPVRAVAVAVFAQSLVLLFGAAFVAQAHVAANLRLVVSESAVEFGASMALVLLGAGATGAAFGRAAGYGFGALLGLWMAVRRVGPSIVSRRGFDRRRARRIGTYAGALAIVDGAFTLFAQMDVLLVGAFLSSVSVGLFTAPARLVALLQYPGLAVANGVAPRLTRGEGQEPNVGAFVVALRYLIVVQAAFLPFVVVWAGPLVHLLLGSDYAGSANVLRTLAPYVFLTGVAPLLSLAVNYLGDARRRVPIAIATVVLSLVLDLILIPRYGIVGAAVGADFGFLLYTPAHLWICRSLIGLPLRPVLLTLVRSLAAAAAASGLLLAVGTRDLSAAQWALGAVGALLAYAALLVASAELTTDDLRAGAALARRLRPR